MTKTLTHAGPGQALIAACVLAALFAGHAAPVALAVAATAGTHAYWRLRRWRPPPGVVACAALALLGAGAAA